jgi:hypothetical protein
MQKPQTLTLDHVSPATRLLEKRRQMFEVQEALDAQKEDYARREDAFRRREDGLRKKDLELQESLIKFNKFLQENESKRNRAIKRAADEKKQRELKEVEIDALRLKLAACGTEATQLADTVGRNMKYTQYLQAVQEEVEEDYQELGDLINRFVTLKDANGYLMQQQEQHEEQTDATRVEFATYAKTRTDEIFNGNNAVASLQQDLEDRVRVKQRLQNSVDDAIRATSHKTLVLGQVLLAVENLRQRCVEDHGVHLKHAESQKEEDAAWAEAAEKERLKRAAASEATSGSASAAAAGTETAAEAAAKLRQTGSDLETVAAYMIDFQAIAESYG